MSALEALVQSSLGDPLSAARSHVQQGGRVIGYVGTEIPVELIMAAGAFPLRLPNRIQDQYSAADRYLESSFMPDVRSVAEQYLQGALDFRAFDHHAAQQRQRATALHYYLSELRTQQRLAAPIPLIYDLAKIPRDSSKAHSRLATRRLAAEVGAAAGELRGAIEKRNRRRRLFDSAATMRSRFNIRGSLMDRIFRAADLCDADRFDAALQEWLPGGGRVAPKARILLIGSAPPDERLHAAVEQAQGNIVAEGDAHPANAVSQPPIDADGSLDAIADHYYSSRESTRAFIDRAVGLQDLAARVQADAVIIWLIEEEDALIWDLPAEMAALQSSGLAALRLVRRRWDAGDGALQEIIRFTQTLVAAL